MLENKAQKINLNFSQFNENNKIIQDLNKNLREIEAIRKDPDNYISEYFGELTRQVDLRRETLIEDIHKYSDELILMIEGLKQDCVAKSKEASGSTNDLDTIKAKMNDLNSTFNSLEFDDIKHGEIMTQKKSKEVSDLMGPVLKKYKFELQGEKYFKLVKITNEIKLEDVFGSLSCFEYDIDNMKVNITYGLQLLFLRLFSHSNFIIFKIDSAIFSAAQEVSFLAITGFENKSFSLLWRGSRDGFDAAAFHRQCDGQANTVTVIKNTNGFIFGGFTSIPWSSSDGFYETDNSAFLFSLTNPSNTSFKLKVFDPQYAVVHNSTYGPLFGCNGDDLCVYNLSNTNRQSYMNLNSYDFPNGMNDEEGGKFIVGGFDHCFQTVEIEVFQVS